MKNNDEDGYSPESIKFLILPEPMSNEMRLHQQTPHEKAPAFLREGQRVFNFRKKRSSDKKRARRRTFPRAPLATALNEKRASRRA